MSSPLNDDPEVKAETVQDPSMSQHSVSPRDSDTTFPKSEPTLPSAKFRLTLTISVSCLNVLLKCPWIMQLVSHPRPTLLKKPYPVIDWFISRLSSSFVTAWYATQLWFSWWTFAMITFERKLIVWSGLCLNSWYPVLRRLNISKTMKIRASVVCHDAWHGC